MTTTFNDIVSGLLRSNETLLWSYGFDPMDVKSEGFFNKHSSLLRWLLALFSMGVLYLNYRIGVFDESDGSLLNVVLFGFFGLILGWLASKFNKSNKLFAPNYPVYQNAFLTQERLVFFNHYDDEWMSLTQDEIESVSLDYARGARAIKVVPINGGEHYLIGPQDFVSPVSLIRTKFLGQAAAG